LLDSDCWGPRPNPGKKRAKGGKVLSKRRKKIHALMFGRKENEGISDKRVVKRGL